MLTKFINFSNKLRNKNNNIIKIVNSKLNGRVCLSNWLHYLLSLKLFMGDTCKCYVEIGTLWGGSIGSLLSLEDNTNTEYIGIDLFSGYYGKDCKANDWNKTTIDVNENNHLGLVDKNLQLLNKNNKKYKLIKGSSYDDETVQKFKNLNKKIDLLFIDGDHSEKGVTLDFMKYKDFLNKDGYILFDNYGDPKTWPEVKVGVDKINFEKFGFTKIGQLGYSFLVKKN